MISVLKIVHYRLSRAVSHHTQHRGGGNGQYHRKRLLAAAFLFGIQIIIVMLYFDVGFFLAHYRPPICELVLIAAQRIPAANFAYDCVEIS